MSLINTKETEMRRNARWLLRLTALAEAKQYLRAGGDLLTLGHHSSKACPAEQKGLIEQVFVKI
ncbi:hypothetical protein MTYM_01009 [Methylococcales bacterium]|nr:hypothetical protein MTYM_01009 [Methylococcales bacterium]